MAETAERLLRLLGLLQRRTHWSGAELAERLEVDVRTVRRDVDRLRALGYQITASTGVTGGYHLGGGIDVPPLLFEDDEAMAVAVVLGASAGAAVPGIERGALTALAKLDRLLPPRLQSQLAALRAATVSLVSPTEVVSTENLVRLAQACDGHQRVTFSYLAHSGAASERRIEPYRLVATDRRWYLVAFDLDRVDWRTFRVDRAASVVVTGHTFVPRPLSDPALTVAEAITTAAYERRAVIRVTASLDEVAQRIPPHVGVLEVDGMSTRVTLGVDDFDWLASYFVGLGFDFEALEPVELRDHLARIGERIARANASSS